MPAVDYTSDELIYAPRNPRPHKVYGYSPVEQILMTVNIGLRRQVSQLNYFTEGNTPEALIGVPEQWTPDQIRQFQEYWDALLEGNLAARRHTRFVPGGLKYQPIRDVPLKDEFDEWLARVVCFAFSVPPTAFSKQTNRATAQGHRTFENPTTDDVLRYDKAEPGEPGFRGRDHYHRDNPDSADKQAPYLDKNGEPVRRGSGASHLMPDDWI